MADQRPTIDVVNNEDEQRFEATVDGHLAVAEYRRTDDAIIFTHTGVPSELEGKGVGSQLAKTALDYARDNQLGVVPLCPFIAGYIKRHPEYQDLVRN